MADTAVGEELLHLRSVPRFCEEGGWEVSEFGDPLFGEEALRVMFLSLLDRGVDADGIDSGGAALHLDLAPVDSWLVVRKHLGEVKACFSPV